MKLAWLGALLLLIPASPLYSAGAAQSSAPTREAGAPLIGLPTGAKAPGFSLRDQFGKEQTLASLRGPKGTVLLFFRSADW